MPDTSGKRSSFLTKITNRYLAVWAKLHGEDSAGDDTKIQTETDGELKVVNYGKDTSANILPIRVEATTGEQDLVLHGKETAASAITPLRAETTTGELHTIINGKDSGGNVDPLRTNDSQQLQVEVTGLVSTAVEVDSKELAAAEAELWDPGTTSADLYRVEFNCVHHIDGAGVNRNPCKITIGKGVGGAAVAIPNWWVYALPLGYPGETGWKGYFTIAGDDTVRGYSSAIKTAVCHFRVTQVASA